MSASLCWIAWNSAIGRPNACRSFAYSRATSYAACAMPTACAAIAIRPPSSVAIATWKPFPSSCSNRSPSTSASTEIEFVVDELRPSFSSRPVTRTCSASRTNAEMPRAPGVGDGAPAAGVAARELRDDEQVGEEAGAAPAVLLRDADAHEPELGELREDVAWEVVLAIPGGRARLDLGADEVARERLD